jgi:peptide-methionine (S)-S-oxide reductase
MTMQSSVLRVRACTIATLLAASLVAALAASPAAAQDNTAQAVATATFAGGCFWCMQPPFDKLEGVVSTTAGYTGGKLASPTYQQVSAGGTGHAESVQVVYDPKRITYEKLLEVFWVNVDPTVRDRQFCDIGSQYRTAIFVHDAGQRAAADASKAALEKSKPFAASIVTEITEATTFYPAEEYHQDYYKKNPIRYSFYRSSCGRDNRLKELWGGRAGGH